MAMRLTVLGQLVKGVPRPAKPPPRREAAEDDARDVVDPAQIAEELTRVKWLLWHGNSFTALEVLEGLGLDLEVGGDGHASIKKLGKAVAEFTGYLAANRAFLVNYGDRYRHGETISSGFVESTVNEVISKRMVKKQQMRWTKAGAHRLLQVRVQVLDEELGRTFIRWHPSMAVTDRMGQQALAA